MKILIILTTKFEMCGITNSVMNYYRCMDKSDMIIDFVVPNKIVNRLRTEIENNGGKIFELQMRNRNPIIYLKKLTKIIQTGEYDSVHAHGNSCTLAVEMYAAKIAGTKIRIAHSRNTTCIHKALHIFLRPIFDRTYTHGFACGKDAGRWLFRDKQFTVITNGNDIDKFAFNRTIRHEYRKKYNLEGKKVIGHVGLFNFQKNHEFLIEVINELVKICPNCILIAVGDGELKPSIEQKVKEMGLMDSVIFTGQSLEVEKLIQAMDIMILPSRYEGLPNVVIEWQIACLPSLISDKVTREVQLTNLVEVMPLEAGAEVWAKRISQIVLVDRDSIKEQVVRQITEAGFNVKENAKELKRLYRSLMNEMLM